MEKIKLTKKQTIISVIVAVLVIAIAGVTIFASIGSGGDNIKKYTISTNSMNESINGAGNLTNYKENKIDLYSGVIVDEVVVNIGELIEKGTAIAMVDAGSLMEAISKCEKEISIIDSQIAGAKNTESTATVEVPVSGRVKGLYAKSGDDVSTVIIENGKLLILSIDGYMAVNIETNTELKYKETVQVRLSSGNIVDGTVDTIVGNKYTILIDDQYGLIGEEVTVQRGETEIDTSLLYVNSPIDILAISGVVEDIYTSLNSLVYAGRTVMVLDEVGENAEYNELITKREVLSEQMALLISASQNNVLLSPYSGTVSSVMVKEGLANNSGTIMTISEDEEMIVTINVDELDILNISYGMEVEVVVGAIGNESYAGEVVSISNTADASGGIASYSVDVLLNKEANMKNGMSASVELIVDTMEDVIMVPIDAINEDQNGSFVYTIKNADGTLSGITYIKTGISNALFVQVTEGLLDGDEIYYEQKVDSSIDGGSTIMPPMPGDGGTPPGGGQRPGSGK